MKEAAFYPFCFPFFWDLRLNVAVLKLYTGHGNLSSWVFDSEKLPSNLTCSVVHIFNYSSVFKLYGTIIKKNEGTKLILFKANSNISCNRRFTMPTLVRDQIVDGHFSIKFVLLYRQKHPILVGLLRNVTAVGACCEINFINWLPIKRKDIEDSRGCN